LKQDSREYVAIALATFY